MLVKPLNYYSASRGFLANTWGHGKFMASKIDSIVRQGMSIYGAVKPIAQEAANAYGGARARQALTNIDRGVSQAAQHYGAAKGGVVKGAALAEKLAGSIGGY